MVLHGFVGVSPFPSASFGFVRVFKVWTGPIGLAACF